MKRQLIRKGAANSSRTLSKSREGIFFQFAILQAALVDADRRQQGELSRMTDFQKPIQMTVFSVHLVTCLAPFDTTCLRQVTIGNADPRDSRLLQGGK